MPGKGQKSRNTSTTVPDSPPRGSADPDMALVLATETFRRELLALLREDIWCIIKLEIRKVLEKEIAGL